MINKHKKKCKKSVKYLVLSWLGFCGFVVDESFQFILSMLGVEHSTGLW